MAANFTVRHRVGDVYLSLSRAPPQPQFCALDSTTLSGTPSAAPLSAALLVPCSGRKLVQPLPKGRAVSLPVSNQEDLETAWQGQLAALSTVRIAEALYAGRGFQLARQAAAAARAPMFVVSAGLGLVSANRKIPSYGVTVANRGPESVSSRTLDLFDPVRWWDSVSRGPFSTPILGVVGTSSLPVLIALSQSYGQMLGPMLESLPDVHLRRLRIFGLNLQQALPRRLHGQILPYDERLESLLPGTRADFTQRAMFHFASQALAGSSTESVEAHSDWVRAALSGHRAPIRPQRPRLSDLEIIEVIKRRMDFEPGAGGMLRALRHSEGVACEQARFSRLYRTARMEGTAT